MWSGRVRWFRKRIRREDEGAGYGIIECAYCYEARANALWPDGGKLALDPVVV